MVKVYMWDDKTNYNIQDLLDIMAVLRGENGCPWDKEQDHSSIRNNLLEEAYEVADAIDRLDDYDMTEELGDLLLQVVFHSQIASERGAFNFDDVADGICKKLIYRHPHIFGSVKADNSDEVLKNWDKLKYKEKQLNTFAETLKAVPDAFPALVRAQKISKRASKAGYDFASLKETVDKLDEELAELKAAIADNDFNEAKSELGDLLFSAVNTARFLKADAEQELSLSTNKFIKRFEKAEQLAISQGLELDTLSPEELDVLWNKAKSST